MRPFRIFLFGLSVILILSVFSIFFQNNKRVLFGYSIKFPSVSSVIKTSKPQYKDISHIILLHNSLTDSCIKFVPAKDTTKARKYTPISDTVTSNLKADSLRVMYHKIEFPPNLDTALFPFFNEISHLLNSKKLIRVLHYGDSQIEGDRITSYLRNQLQVRFGGSGIGLFSILAPNPASISYVYDVSDNWKKFSPLQGAMEDNTRHYGVLVNFARINQGNSLFVKNKELNGWIDLKYPNISYPLAQQSEQLRIFYGFNKAPMMVELTQNNSVVEAEMVPPSSSLQELHWNMASPRNIRISFKTTNSPEVYGLSLDAGHGVAVDNIPLRGSSGLEFAKMDNMFLRDFFRKLNVKLVILQFGVNVVPNLASNYDYYEKLFYKQLLALKQANPNLPVLVIGVSDMSRNGENGYESYPNIEMVRDAQKKASFAAGCAFWDIFEAMGGRNSMPSWVFANPPLAQKDFTHFNPLGAKIIGEMFYRSFIFEYERYLAVKQKDNNVVSVLK
jgi:hypothetical protein